MFEQLVDIICNYVEIEQEDIKPESRFMEDLGFTSFDFMSMLGEIEDEMGRLNRTRQQVSEQSEKL